MSSEEMRKWQAYGAGPTPITVQGAIGLGQVIWIIDRDSCWLAKIVRLDSTEYGYTMETEPWPNPNDP